MTTGHAQGASNSAKERLGTLPGVLPGPRCGFCNRPLRSARRRRDSQYCNAGCRAAAWKARNPECAPQKLSGIEEARRRRDDGMARAEDHADRDLLEQWWTEFERYCEVNAYIFCDEVLDYVSARLPMPRERRSLGPCLYKKAARRGLIVKTGSSRPSASSNLSLKPVWRSLVYRNSNPNQEEQG